MDKELNIQLKNSPIGFFDSGVGGLTVFEKVKKILPNEDYIYFGDLKNIPYGEKNKEQLIEFADGIFKFFESKGVKAVVMACNTTSATVYEELKDKYNFKIYPIIQSCAKIIAGMGAKKIGVFATNATINSGIYSKELKKYDSEINVYEMACPPWVKIVEQNIQNEPASVEIVSFFLGQMLKNRPEKIVLGCTHYPYLLDILTIYAPRELFIDPSVYFAQYIKEDLEKNNMLNDNNENATEEFYVSADPEGFKTAANTFYPMKKLPQLV